jgi:membrane fusion protein (multidrug efflux system)
MINKQSMRYIQVFLFLLTIIFFSCKSESKNAELKKEVSTNKTDPQKPAKVNGIVVKSEYTTGKINTSGTLLSDEEAEIKSEVSGRITQIYFKEGQYINKGQLMVKLNDDDLQAQMKKLQIEIKLAADKENRQKSLLAASAISKEDYENILGNLDLLKANAEILKTQINKTKIIAPFSGIVGFKNVSPGAFISNANMITTIQSIKPLKLEFSIPEKYNHLLTVGASVSFKTAQNDDTHTAVIYAKDPKIDPVTRTVIMRAKFANSNGKLTPGSFAEIEFQLGSKQKVIKIPSIAYIPDINGPKVFVSKNGMATSVPVKSGLRTAKEIEILEGLAEGDTVLTTGLMQLKPKSPVSVIINSPSE